LGGRQGVVLPEHADQQTENPLPDRRRRNSPGL
jgi:hypothetical protein